MSRLALLLSHRRSIHICYTLDYSQRTYRHTPKIAAHIATDPQGSGNRCAPLVVLDRGEAALETPAGDDTVFDVTGGCPGAELTVMAGS